MPASATDHLISIPGPRKAIAYNPGYRYTHTNKQLGNAGIDALDRDFVFDAFGKKTVLQAIALYFGSSSTSGLENRNFVDSAVVRSGLISTMMLIKKRGYDNTKHLIANSEDVSAIVQSSYKRYTSFDSSPNRFQQEEMKYLVDTFVMGLRDKLH